MNTVTVIIVNWNSGDLLRRCVTDLLRQTVPPTRILVMENGSVDGSVETILSLPGVTPRILGENLGFAAGNNRAIAECDTEFVALLNPDAFPEPGWLEALLAAARAQPSVAAFGCRQMRAECDGLLDGLGDIYHFSGLVWRRGHGRAQRDEDLLPCEIFSPCAAAALYRRQALIAVGGFDEDFFCYVEDVDLGFRLRLAGYGAVYVPEAVVHHVGSATTGGQQSDFAVYHGHRNLVWAYVKNMPGVLFWIFLPFHLGLNLVSILALAWRGQGAVILRAKRDAILALPRVWRQRRRIEQARAASTLDILRILDKRMLPRRTSGNDSAHLCSTTQS